MPGRSDDMLRFRRLRRRFFKVDISCAITIIVEIPCAATPNGGCVHARGYPMNPWHIDVDMPGSRELHIRGRAVGIILMTTRGVVVDQSTHRMLAVLRQKERYIPSCWPAQACVLQG